MTSFDPNEERKRRAVVKLSRERQIEMVAQYLIRSPDLSPGKWSKLHKDDPELKASVNNIQERLISARTYCGLGAYSSKSVRYQRYLEVAEKLEVMPAAIWTKEMFLRAEFKILDLDPVPVEPELELTWEQIKEAVFDYMELRCLEAVSFLYDDTVAPVSRSVTGRPREKVVL